MKSLCLFTILTGIFTVAAGNLSWQTPGGSAAAEKDGIVSITGGSELISTNKIPVNPAKAYCYTGFIRCTDVSDAAIQFGIICFDKKNKIKGYTKIPDVKPITLTHDARTGDDILFTDSLVPYAKSRMISMDMQLLDNNAMYNVISSPAKNGQCQILLVEKMKKDYPTGTQLRAIFKSDAKVNCTRIIDAGKEWKEFYTVVYRVDDFADNTFRPGTHSVKLFISSNDNRPVNIELKNLRFSELPSDN